MRNSKFARLTGVLAATALLATPALADPAVLPADTVFAVGLNNVDQNAERFQPFVDEWNRLGLTESLGTLLDTDDELDAAMDELDALDDVDFLELIGDSAWLSVSLSASNPVPVVTFMSRPTGDALAQVNDQLAAVESEPGTLTLTEGNYTFWVVEIDEEATEGLVTGVAVTLIDDQLIFSSTPDALRGVLRLMGGSNEPSLAGVPAFGQVAHLQDSDIFSYVDMGAGARTAQTFARPFAQEFGVGALLDEAVSALATAGVLAGGNNFTADGMSGTSVQVVGDDNATIRSLLLDRSPASQDALAFVPAEALAVSSGFSNPTAWWGYFNTLVASYPELGISSLDDLLLMFVGLDLRSSFFSWVGNEMTTITTGLTATGAPGVASDNLLGENLYILRTDADADAQAGLDTIMQMASMMLGAFTSLDGSTAGQPDTGTSETVDGVNVRTFTLTDGVIVSYAVTDGFVLIATDATSVAAALEARAAGAVAPETVNRLMASIPADVVSFSVSDNEASLRSLAGQTAAQVEMVAGLSGGGIDFDALDSASSGIEEFLNFVADHLDGSWAFTTIDGNVITSESFTEVDW